MPNDEHGDTNLTGSNQSAESAIKAYNQCCVLFLQNHVQDIFDSVQPASGLSSNRQPDNKTDHPKETLVAAAFSSALQAALKGNTEELKADEKEAFESAAKALKSVHAQFRQMSIAQSRQDGPQSLAQILERAMAAHFQSDDASQRLDNVTDYTIDIPYLAEQLTKILEESTKSHAEILDKKPNVGLS
ncbi:MAG: hypothetical protein VXW87_04665 [Pseudomonadota bacterium]|nr:hypothetical protein [Pseudomonadota bacterium]